MCTFAVFKPILRGKADAVSVADRTKHGFHGWMVKKLTETIWEKEVKPGSKAWYTDNQGRCFALYPASQADFWYKTKYAKERDFTYKNKRTAR